MWLGFTELERYLKEGGFQDVETAVVYRGQEAPCFVPLPAPGKK